LIDRAQPARVAAAAAACIVAVCALYLYFLRAPGLYGGFDGILMKHLVIERRRWLEPLEANALNPYQGVANVWFATSAWLNPGYAVFALLPDLRQALPVSYTVFALAYAGAAYLFVRALAPETARPIAWAIGFIAALAVLPPLNTKVGVYPTFDFAPGGAYYAALYLVMLALLLKLGEGGAARQAAIAIALAALSLYGVFCDPMWMPMLLVSVAPFGLAALAAELSWRRAVLRLIVCAAVLAALYALGVVDYVTGVAGYTARLFFWEESIGLQREPDRLFFGLRNARGFWLAAVLVLGFVPAALWGATRVRVLALACLATMAGLAAYSLAFLTLRRPWPYPLPLYLEIMALPVFIAVACTGLLALARRLGWRRAAPLWAVPAVLVVLACASLAKFHRNDRPELALFVQRGSPVEIAQILIDETALAPGASFRGTTAATSAFFVLNDAYRKALGQGLYFPDLWAQRVPTFHEYSQLGTPPLYYLVSRLAASPPFEPHNITPFPGSTPKALALLRAYGVRFFLSDRELGGEQTLRSRWTGRDVAAYLYELPDPNLGNYSPTLVRPHVQARAALAELTRPDFDFRREVVLEQAPPVTLTPAKNAHLAFERGGARVRAQSEGISLLLLPIQFSHCLALDGAPQARLVRANLVQAGLLFQGALDARLDYSFSPFERPRCRSTDLDDLRRADLRAEARRVEPDWTVHAPWSGESTGALLASRLRDLALGR